jgi:hypothetical protein
MLTGTKYRQGAAEIKQTEKRERESEKKKEDRNKGEKRKKCLQLSLYSITSS